MKFAHMADVHVGSWRDPKLKELSLDAFLEAIDESIHSKVDFILISGDLFNTALPSIDHVRLVVRKLKEAKVLFTKALLIRPDDTSATEGLSLIK